MKVLLQGYLFDANFGDILSALLFYRRCLKNKFEAVDFIDYKDLGIGQFCRKQLGYEKKKNLLSCLWADALVIISGGSFWNDKNNPYDAEKRYRRFVLPARVFQMLGKPVYVLGVGGGAVETPWLREKMVNLLNKAKVVTFRDEETRKTFVEYGVKNEMTVTADTMLVIEKDMLDELEEKNSLDARSRDRKKMLLHIPDGASEVSIVAEKIVPAVIKFLKAHKDYFLVLSNDNVREIGPTEQSHIDKICAALDAEGINHYDYRYHDCWQMCSLIGEMDCVITSKLHVGVVASALGKCVVAFPVHKEKTDNFYRMIGESGRCMNVRILDSEKAYEQIEKYHNQPVKITDEMRKRAEMNLSVLDNINHRK